jgi:hypothetical protein
MKFGRILARRNVHERQVIACLRGNCAFELRDIPDAKDAFSNLADIARQRGAVIFASESPFVGDTEIEILTPAGSSRRRIGGGTFASHRFAKGEAVRARALSLARTREVASTEEFAAIGVSRQYVSRLCKDGYLQRVRYGWYRAAPVSDRGFAAHRQSFV